MQAPRRELVPETKLPKRRHAQLRDARGLLRLPQDPAEVDDVLEALALIDLDERHWAAGRVVYRKSTKVALRKALAALRRLKEAYAAHISIHLTVPMQRGFAVACWRASKRHKWEVQEVSAHRTEWLARDEHRPAQR